MSVEIDERVVEMRFDNKQFEKGTKETMSTLERLKKALHLEGATSGLNNIEKSVEKVNLNGLISGVEFLEKRFSTLGIVGMRVIENMTDSLIRMATSGFNFVSDTIISGGIKRAMNIENAHFQLQALLKDEKKVQAVMDDAMKSVDGTAYAYDEAAKAASMFAATGIEAGDDMLQALRGIVGTAAMTNSEFESIAMIFTTVAGNGRLMGDQLLQLSSRGLNAASTIADFVNRVNDGTANVSEDVKKLVKEFSKGTKMTEGDIRELVSEGAVSFKLFSAAMTEAFADSAERANETFTGALSNMKSALARIGAEFISPLVAQNSEVVGLFNSLRLKINEVKKGLTMDGAIGEFTALSTRFTTGVLAMAKSVSKFVDNADLSEPLKIFYHWVGIVENVAQGLYIFLRPIAEAFSDVFLSFKVSDITDIMSAFEKLTEKFRLNHRQAKNLKDAFSGLFNVVKLGIDIFLKLIQAIIPVGKPITSLADLLLSAAGAAGRALTKFTEWIREAPLLERSFNGISSAIKSVMGWLSRFISGIYDFVKEVSELPETQKILNHIMEFFQNLGKTASKAFDTVVLGVSKFKDSIKNMLPENAEDVLKSFLDFIKNFGKDVEDIDTSSSNRMLDIFKAKIEELTIALKKNEGLNTFIDSMTKSFDRFRNALKFEGIYDALDTFKNKVGSFGTWLKEKVGPIFDDFTVSGAIAGGSGLAMVYSLLKASKSLTGLTDSIKKIPDVFGALNNALNAYADAQKASRLKEFAKALLMLAAALVVMSFTDTEKVMQAATALSMVGGILFLGSLELKRAIGAAQSLENGLYKLSSGLGKALKNFGKSLKYAAIAQVFKSFGTSILKIAASIIALAVMYRKDSAAVEQALKIVAIIAGAMTTIIGIMSLMGPRAAKSVSAFGRAATGIAFIALSVSIVVLALKKMFEMQLPEDYETKFKMLAGIFLGLTGLAIILGIASNGFGKGKINFTSMLAITASMFVVVEALKRLFELELPNDYEDKLKILAGIFAGLVVVMAAMGKAAKISGGTIKAAGTILAMAVFLGAVVAALMILANFPAEDLNKGAIALGVVLLALGQSLKGAGRIVDKNAYKSVIAMAINVGVIVAALGVLSMISLPDLTKSVVMLGAMLLILAQDFKAIGKIANGDSAKSVLNMALLTGVIAISLAVLTTLPMPELLVSATTLSAVLLVFANVLKKISGMTGLKIEKIKSFLLATIAFLPIVTSLAVLANQPWEGLLAGSVALAAVLEVFGNMLKKISKLTGLKKEKILLFLACTVALAPIAASLYFLADKPWASLLAAGIAMTEVLSAMSLAFFVVSKAKPNLAAIGLFASAVVPIVGIAASLYFLSEQPIDSILAAANGISEVLGVMSIAMGVAAAVGALGLAAIKGIGVFDLFIADLTAVLVILGALSKSDTVVELVNGGIQVLKNLGDAIGGFVGSIVSGFAVSATEGLTEAADNLSAFGEHIQPFLDIVKGIDKESAESVGYLVDSILALTKSNAIEKLSATFLGGDTNVEDLGQKLEDFAPHIVAFSNAVKDINPRAVEGAAAAAQLMAELEKNLPKHNGVIQWFMGDTSLEEFGKSLTIFGTHIRKFAGLVKDVDPASVEGAAAAGKILAELEANLPKHGGVTQWFTGDNTLKEFGGSLVIFGTHIRKFAGLVKDVDPASVEGAAAAGSIMSSLEENLPRHGGIISWFRGDNDLATFGKSLVTFGTHIRNFAATVKNINPASIIGVSIVTSIMTALAKDVPTSGGIISWFRGDNKIDSFGKSLKKYGEYIAAFSKEVQGIDPAVIKGVATITEIFTALAHDIPTTGGIISWFRGDNSIDGFGKDLKKFGKYISDFYDEVQGIDPVGFGTIVNALKVLLDLSGELSADDTKPLASVTENLSEIGQNGLSGFVNAFKTGTKDATSSVGNFFQQIVSTIGKEKPRVMSVGTNFATGLTNSVIRGVNDGKPNVINTITSLNTAITDRFNYDLNANTLTANGLNLANGLIAAIESKRQESINTVTSVGTSTGQAFADAINSKNPVVTAVSAALGATASNSIIGNVAVQSVIDTGYNVGQAFADALNSKWGNVNSAGASLGSTANSSISGNASSDAAYNVGVSVGTGFVNGINAKHESSSVAGAQLARAGTGSIKSNASVDEIYQVGVNVGAGFVNGVRSKISDAESAGAELGKAATRGAKNNLNVRSPSRVFMSIGSYTAEGFAIGLRNGISDSEAAAEEMADKVLLPMKVALAKIYSTVDKDWVLTPTITPVVDTSNIEGSAKLVNQIFKKDLRLDETYGIAKATADTMRYSQMAQATAQQTAMVDKTGAAIQQGPTFIQNNYSPKALSRSDIYRQTRNLISAAT